MNFLSNNGTLGELRRTAKNGLIKQVSLFHSATSNFYRFHVVCVRYPSKIVSRMLYPFYHWQNIALSVISIIY